jgi:hypothetical protein
MRLLIALFVLAVMAAATANLGVEIWEGRFGQHDPALRAIHYDTTYRITGQHRIRPTQNSHGG